MPALDGGSGGLEQAQRRRRETAAQSRGLTTRVHGMPGVSHLPNWDAVACTALLRRCHTATSVMATLVGSSRLPPVPENSASNPARRGLPSVLLGSHIYSYIRLFFPVVYIHTRTSTYRGGIHSPVLIFVLWRES